MPDVFYRLLRGEPTHLADSWLEAGNLLGPHVLLGMNPDGPHVVSRIWRGSCDKPPWSEIRQHVCTVTAVPNSSSVTVTAVLLTSRVFIS